MTTEDYHCRIVTDEFIHTLSANKGVIFDKRSGPALVGLVYPKWGVKRVVGRFGIRKSPYNIPMYRALILWHDCVFHDIPNAPDFDTIAELFDQISEKVGMSDLKSDLGEFFTKHFGKDTFGGEDIMSKNNRELITATFTRPYET